VEPVTKFYIAGDGTDAADELRRQLYQFGDETVVQYTRADEIIVMPGFDVSDWSFMRDPGKPVCEAHRDQLADGGYWRLHYDQPDDVLPAIGQTGFSPAGEYWPPPAAVWGGPLDDNGMHNGSSAITTISGRKVDPLNLTVDDIDIEDIAHALARQVRYNGHVSGFLSVARHSLWVSRRLTGTYDALAKPGDRDLQLWGLLHDAAETYIGDCVKPLKHSAEMQAFRDIEEQVDKRIALAFNLEYPMPPEVKQADKFVTLEVEIGLGLKDTDGDYRQDESDFLEAFYRLERA
jgi:5'-deoxynucleotidase YfbR-like HD superfamily hydrolase